MADVKNCCANSEEHESVIVQALDTLGCALVDHDHVWTDEERRLYEVARLEALKK